MWEHTVKTNSSLESQSIISYATLARRRSQWLWCPKQAEGDRILLKYVISFSLANPTLGTQGHMKIWQCQWPLLHLGSQGLICFCSSASLPSASGWTLSSYSLFWNSKWVTFPRSHGKCMAENKAALFTHITSNVLALRCFMTSPGLQPQHCVCLLAREQERVESSRSLTWTWWEIPSRSVGLFHCFSLCSIKDSACGRLKERPYLS